MLMLMMMINIYFNFVYTHSTRETTTLDIQSLSMCLGLWLVVAPVLTAQRFPPRRNRAKSNNKHRK